MVNHGRPSARTPSWEETELAKQPGMMPYVAPPAVQTAALSIGAPSSSAFYADMNAAFLLPIGAEGFVFSGALSGLRIGGIMATGASFERAMLLNGVSSELRTGAMLARAGGANSSIVWENLVQAGLAAKTPLTPPTTALAKYWPENSGFIGHVDRTHLLPGTVIDRHGYPSGTFVSPFGTPFGARGLPDAYLTSKPYKIYEVLKPIEVNTGQIRPWFYQPGLGIQHELPVSVEILLKRGFLKEVTP